MKKIGIPGTARASFYLYNGIEDVDALIKGIEKVIEIFKLKEKRYITVQK
jgi:cysteine desulfurase/selenocysteine lyase